MTSTPPSTRSQRFDATPASARQARHFATTAAEALGWASVTYDVESCVAELASNAVLHTRAGYEVRLDAEDGRLRIEVIDSRPSDLPFAVPATGLGRAVIDFAPTGRGLRVVAGLATRWGVATAATTKTVWAEFGPETDVNDPIPVVTIGHDAPTDSADAVTLDLLNLPALAAVASGMQVDGLVRELQLGLFDDSVADAERLRFYDLLDASAPVRLAGRHAALIAAAAGEARFDMTTTIDAASIIAVSALSELLAELPSKQPLTNANPSPAVLEFRVWLQGEVGRQLGGAAPEACDLPD